MAVKALSLLTASGPKSHLGSFAQVLCQHYEVDQRLRVAAVLKRGREKDRKLETRSPQSKQQQKHKHGVKTCMEIYITADNMVV